MNQLVGQYGYINAASDVIECSDANFSWEKPGWWHTHLLCTDENSSVLKLIDATETAFVMVKKTGFLPLGKPLHHIGEQVCTRKGRTATIYRVCWHDVRERFFYLLDYGSRKSTNRFFDEDIVSA